MNCIVCNSDKKTQVFKNTEDYEYGTYRNVNFSECQKCDLIFQDPLPPKEIIGSFYPEIYRNYISDNGSLFSVLKKLQFKTLAKKILSKVNNNDKYIKILDIGFGNGELLLALKEKGYKNLYGTDFSNKNFERLKKKEINIELSDVEECLPFKEEFDAIIMNHVIEHFLDPVKVLKNCLERLKTNGKLILLTPNTNALEYSIFKKYWAGLHIPRHTFIFNDKNIKQLGETLGFRMIKICAVSDPGQWSISLQNVLQSFNFSKVNLKNGMAWYSVPLSAVFIPITLLQNIIGKSTSVMCIFSKN